MNKTDSTPDTTDISQLTENLLKKIESSTDKTKLQHELNQDIEDMHSLNRAARDFLQVVSTNKSLNHEFLTKINHELRTPLVPVLAYTEMLLNSKFGPISDEQKKRLEIIQTSTKEIVQTIHDLFNENRAYLTSNKSDSNQDHRIKEIIQEKIILDKTNTVLSDELEAIKKTNTEFEKNLQKRAHTIHEVEQEKTILDKTNTVLSDTLSAIKKESGEFIKKLQERAHTIHEVEQEKTILDKTNTVLSDELKKVKKEEEGLEKEIQDKTHRIKELEQEKLFTKELRSKDLKMASMKNLSLQLEKKHIISILCSVVAIAIITTTYSIMTVQLVGQQYAIPSSTPIKSGYVIQDLQGDTIDTWLSWRLADDTIIHVNVVDAKKYPGKLDLVKEVISSEETIEIDDSLLQKGPKGSISTYYTGWEGALEKASQKATEFIIPTKFTIIESSRGVGEITIRLTDERDADGYSGYTKSIADPSQNQILKSDITIYQADKLNDDQFKAIVRHEFGHALGLAHSTATEDLMAPTIKTAYPYISDCDIDAIQSLYDGNKKSDVVCEK